MARTCQQEFWIEDVLLPRVDATKRGASPHQRELRFAHPEWFRAGDLVRVGEERLVGTGKFFYGIEEMRALNEVVAVQEMRDDGVAICERGVGANPAQRIRRGDVLYIIGSAASLARPEGA